MNRYNTPEQDAEYYEGHAMALKRDLDEAFDSIMELNGHLERAYIAAWDAQWYSDEYRRILHDERRLADMAHFRLCDQVNAKAIESKSYVDLARLVLEYYGLGDEETLRKAFNLATELASPGEAAAQAEYEAALDTCRRENEHLQAENDRLRNRLKMAGM